MSSGKWLLEVLTPLHIGSGEDADAFDSAVVGGEFLRINDNVVLERCTQEERDQLVQLSKRPAAYAPRLGAVASGIDGAVIYRIPVRPQAADIYASRASGDQVTDLSCRTFVKTTGCPYIPGSSLKGAIRTAVLNEMVKKPFGDLNNTRVQAEAFGYLTENTRTGKVYPDISRDPFSAVRFADSAPLLADTLELDVVEVVTKKRQGWQPTLLMLVETLCPQRAGSISMNVTIVDKRNLSKPITMQLIISAARNFSVALIERELEFCSGYPPLKSFYEDLKVTQAGLASNEFLLRLGWGSGFDAVSTNLARSPKEPKYSRRVLRGSGSPLSWIKVTVEE